MIREAQYWKVCKTGFMFEMGATAASFIVYQRVRDKLLDDGFGHVVAKRPGESPSSGDLPGSEHGV